MEEEKRMFYKTMEMKNRLEHLFPFYKLYSHPIIIYNTGMDQNDHKETEWISGYHLLKAYEERGKSPLSITIQRGDSLSYTYHSSTTETEEDFFFMKKMILTLLWMVGGDKVLLKGNHKTIDSFIRYAKEDKELKQTFHEMTGIFRNDFVIEETDQDFKNMFPDVRIDGSFQGYRIGLDLGGSDRKIVASYNGNVLFQDETPWSPKTEEDSSYHYKGILESLRKAKSHLKQIDSIGISTAGIIDGNRMEQATLFWKVKDLDREGISRFFSDFMEKEFPNVRYKILNDGDVAAYSGAYLFHKEKILGLTFGTSLGSGYMESVHSSLGWVIELGKVPVDYSEDARSHYSMGIKGSGSEYLSQKGIIWLCKKAGLEYEGSLPVQLVQIQKDAEKGNQKVLAAYQELGRFIGEAIALYHEFLPFENVIVLGRVMSGKGGDLMLKSAADLLKEEKIDIHLFSADETFKRLGQAYMAASL